MVLRQSRRRTFDACEVPKRGLDHIAVSSLKPLHQLVAHLVHKRRFLVATFWFLERKFTPVQGSVTVMAERYEVVPVICSAVLALYDVVYL